MSKKAEFADAAANATSQFRASVEKSIEQSKEAYDKLKNSTEEAQKAFENSAVAARTASSEISIKSFDALRTNAEAALAHMEALAGARTPSEFMELQIAYWRRYAEMTVAQAKELQAVATKAAEDVAKPVKAAFDKASKGNKA